jgi:chaperonin GroES
MAYEEQETPAYDKQELQSIIESTNLAENYDEETLNKMGSQVVEWFNDDDHSRQEWLERNNEWLKLATQVIEKKTTPWPDAANVKFPLLTTAAMQFAARAYPALVPGPNLVAGLVIGKDEGGQKQQVADRVGRHMSYQLLYEMKGWEEDMDRLCLMLPIIGCLFKKTYYDPIKKMNVSELILPEDLVIDYFAKSVETATRKTHIIYRTNNQISERQRRGIFLDIELGDPINLPPNPVKDQISGKKEPKLSPATPHKFIECHCWWDADNDGIEEPYIVTVHYSTRKVVRVVARFNVDGLETLVDESTGKEKLVGIKPLEFFTKFGFIPNPDGSIYDLGFGILLGGINESVNTLTNQLIDSGTLNNLQAGFLGRGIRVRSGNTRFIPGEWKPSDFVGDDIRKHVYPLPTKEPSGTLFQLLEALVTSGKELASVAEIFVGKMPGQNTPATTTMATIEQGLKVFTAIYKRIYRALNQEYEKLFLLNKDNLDTTVYFTINEPQGPVGQQVEPQDYQSGIAVKPNADPNVVSSAQKLMKVQSYGPLLEMGTINMQEYTKRYLEAVEAENISALMQPNPPQPDPEEKKMQMEMQQSQQEHQMKMQVEQMKAQLTAQIEQLKLEFEKVKLQLKAKEAELKFQVTAQQAQLEAAVTQQEHVQTLTQNEQKHRQVLLQNKQKQEAKPQK